MYTQLILLLLTYIDIIPRSINAIALHLPLVHMHKINISIIIYKFLIVNINCENYIIFKHTIQLL